MVKRGGPNGRPYKPPWPLEPQPFRPLFDFRVVVVWDQAARLLSSAWSQSRAAAVALSRCRQAAADVRFRAAATAAAAALLPSRCRAAAKLPSTSAFTLPPPPQLPRCCRRAAAAATAPSPSCRRPRAVALPPPPRRRSLVGCCVVVRRPISSSHAVMRPSLSSTASTAAAGPPGRRNCWGLAPRVHFCLHLGEDWRIFSGVFSVCRFVNSICRTNRAYTCKYYLSNK